MKSFFYSLLLMLFTTFSYSQNSIQLKNRINTSDVIIEGKVVSQNSFWNADSSSIYTESIIDIYKIFKGEPNIEQASIITFGGIVGDDFQFMVHSNQIANNAEGVFFLKRNNGNEFRLFGNNPVIEYRIQNSQFSAFTDGVLYTNPRDLYSDITSSTGGVEKKKPNSIEVAIKKWLTSNLVFETEDGDPIVIEFSFDNVELIGTQKVEFDILTRATQEGIKFASSEIFLKYSQSVFGTNIVANDKIEAIKKEVISNSVYTLGLQDQADEILKFIVNSVNEPDSLYHLSQIAEKFIHLKLDIENVYELTTISFADSLMTNQSFFYDETTGEYVGFDRVGTTDPIYPLDNPAIVDFSPKKVPAGTKLDEHILVITGMNFGDHNDADGNFDTACTECKVRFRNGDNDSYFDNIYAYGTDIVSWFDTEIRLHVPSATTSFKGPASSGKFRVESPTGPSNEKIIDIPYSVMNIRLSTDPWSKSFRLASQAQTSDGIVFKYSKNMESELKPIFKNTLEEWCNDTQIAWHISNSDSDLTEINGNDGINLVTMRPDNEFLSDAAAAVVFSGHRANCGPSFYIKDVDIKINQHYYNNLYNPTKFYNILLHELGHAHLLNHATNPDAGPTYNSQYLMYYLSEYSSNHNIQSDDKTGALTIFPSSNELLSIPNCSSINPIFQGSCGVLSTSFLGNSMKRIEVFPNPFKDNITVSIEMLKNEELTISVINILGQTIHVEHVDNVSGERVFHINLPSEKNGIYFIEIKTKDDFSTLKITKS